MKLQWNTHTRWACGLIAGIIVVLVFNPFTEFQKVQRETRDMAIQTSADVRHLKEDVGKIKDWLYVDPPHRRITTMKRCPPAPDYDKEIDKESERQMGEALLRIARRETNSNTGEPLPCEN